MSLIADTFYGLPHCSTCQKAQAYLTDNGVTIQQYVDVKHTAVDKQTLQHLAQKLGGVSQLFSKRALKYRAMGLHEKMLSDDEMLDLMHTEYTFIKRPVVVMQDGRVASGFTAKAFLQLVTAASLSV